jgi:hypothetical protein
MEAKTKKGKPTALQIIYLNDNVEAQGFSAIVRSVADAKEVLRQVWFKIRNKI